MFDFERSWDAKGQSKRIRDLCFSFNVPQERSLRLSVAVVFAGAHQDFVFAVVKLGSPSRETSQDLVGSQAFRPRPFFLTGTDLAVGVEL